MGGGGDEDYRPAMWIVSSAPSSPARETGRPGEREIERTAKVAEETDVGALCARDEWREL